MWRVVLFAILAIFVARAFWRLVDGVVEGATGRPRSPGVPSRGVQMARDPVCGTYVIPDRAVALTEHGHQFFFCSTACRDKHRARTA
jgi:YHS domain-containing protein